jgi:WD40 repeat protein
MFVLVCLGAGLWSQFSDYRTLGHHSRSVYAIAFAPDGKTLYSGSRDAANARSAGKVWDVASGRELHTFPGGRDVTLSPDGQLVAAIIGDGQMISVRDTQTGTKGITLRETPAEIWRMAFSGDGNFLATAGVPSAGAPGELGLWELATGRKVREFQIEANNVYGLSFSPDGKTIAFSSGDGYVHLWELESGTELAVFPTREKGEGGVPDAVAFSPDGRYLAAPRGSSLLIWEVPTRKLVATLPTSGYGPALCLAFSPDGRFLAAGGKYAHMRILQGCLVTLWEVGTWQERTEVKGRIDPNGDIVYCVAFSPDGSRLAIGSARGYVGLVKTDR